MRRTHSRRAALRLAALASASMFALPAQAQLLGGLLSGGETTVSNPVRPMWGNLRPFYGNIRPFYGNLRPFYGNLRPFWGNLRPFWGDTAAFYGDFKSFWAVENPVVGAGAPAYPQVGEYWTVAGGTWDQIWTAWNARDPATATSGDYRPVADQLRGLIGEARKFWGASVSAQTGKSFDDAFMTPLLKRYAIDLARPSSLSELDQTERALFFLEFYDGLMNFSGTDHVDHWMKTINWSPALTKTQGGGASVIGILDQTVVGDATISGSVVRSGGVSDFTNGHGAAVGSLIVAPHDGKGVMGIAPKASVIAYNPFDYTGTASWADVTKGVQMLKGSGASVVNMSLGVPGMTFDPGWNKVFTNLGVTLTLKNTVFVVAAGNEGASQTKHVEWLPLNPAIVVVGSVDVEGNISNFSNRPGSACLTLLGLCLPGNRLMDRFIVAPGEMILVSDGEGGITRQIGSSFAAPQVSGAIALLHDRWPWLKDWPRETVDIILKSAKDLGAPGTDPVYGRGLLDVSASQSPLDFNRLTWFTVENGEKKLQTRQAVLDTYRSEQQAAWDAKGAYFYAFEPLGPLGLTQRDFAIPLSSKLLGQTVTTWSGSQEQFQAYLLARMDAWAGSQSLASAPGGQASGFFTASRQVMNPWGAEMRVAFAPRHARYGFRDEGPAYQSALTIANERSSVTVGFGDGAAALMAQPGFSQASDYDGERGGANPLLGFASGGVYAGWTYDVSERLQVSTSVMQRDQQRLRGQIPALGVPGNGAEAYQAEATQVAVAYRPAPNVTLSASYTRLGEATGLLGVQSLDPNDFRRGSTTEGLSLGLSWQPTSKLSFAASGTLGRTRASGEGQAIRVEEGGLTTTAFQLAVTGADLFAKGDTARLTLSQPLFVERGRLAADVVAVVDRSTGEIGITRQTFEVGDGRRLAAEMLYGLPLHEGAAGLSFFGRVEGDAAGEGQTSVLGGARYRLAF
jgi:hypothetical protein